MDRRDGRRLAGSALLSATWIWTTIFAIDAGAQETPTFSDNLVRVGLSELLQSASEGGTEALQTYHLTRLARQLQAAVIESMDEAPIAEAFPGTEAVLDLQDAVGSAGGAASPFDPGVRQGIEELVSWFQLRSWSRGGREACFDEEGQPASEGGRPAGLEMSLTTTNSWWSQPGRMSIARRLTHSLALFYERSHLARRSVLDPAATVVCMAEGDRDAEVARLALYTNPTLPRDIVLSAGPGTDPQTQIDLTWEVDQTGNRDFQVQQSSGTDAVWVPATEAPEDSPGVTISGLSPGTTYHFRVGPVGAAELSNPVTASTIVDPFVAGPDGGNVWLPRLAVPALGAALVTLRLLTRGDDDGPRSGTVIVRIPVG